MAEFITQTAFAKLVGVSARTIRKHIQTGKIFGDALNERKRIDPDVARVQLASILDGRGGKRDEMGGDPNKVTRFLGGSSQKPQKAANIQEGFNKAQAESDSKMYLKSRATKEIIGAKMAGLDLKEREGTLIKRESVKNASFNYGRGARDKLMTVGTRLAPVLVHKTSEHDIKMMIDAEIREAIDDLISSFKDYE